MRSVDEDNRTVYCGNLVEEVADKVLYELFNQAGPVEGIRRPRDCGRPKSYAFIIFKHECSVPYALELFKGTKLFNRSLNLSSRSNHRYHVPVLDTHLTEFVAPNDISEREHRNSKCKIRDFHQRTKEDHDQDTASSWAELKNNPLKANRFVSNHSEHGVLNNHNNYPMGNVSLPDINALLQMGQHMFIPGAMGLQGYPGMPNLPLGFGPSFIGNNIFPSMQGIMNGGERHSSPRERGRQNNEVRERRGYGDRERRVYEDKERRDYEDSAPRGFSDSGVIRNCDDRREKGDHHRARENRRDHPYDDRYRNHRADHKHHFTDYSSRSLPDREPRDRRRSR